jgi:addiction module antidote protein, HigA family
MLPTHRKPIHPGEILLEEFLKPLGLSQEAFAAHLGGSWTQSKMSAIINARRGVTEEVALDFAEAFGTSPQFWLAMQSDVNLWEALQKRKRNHRKVKKIAKRTAPRVTGKKSKRLL